LHRGSSSVTVAQGNHDISGHIGIIEPTQQISILHFPYRSFSATREKFILGVMLTLEIRIFLLLLVLLGELRMNFLILMICCLSGKIWLLRRMSFKVLFLMALFS
jgi:hypothetical protein